MNTRLSKYWLHSFYNTTTTTTTSTISTTTTTTTTSTTTTTARTGAILLREGPNERKKLVSERPKTKLAESQFLKRNNCHSIKRN